MPDEIARLVWEIGALNKRIAAFGTVLAPVYQRDSQLRAKIADTHGGPGKFNPDGAAARKPTFEALTEIAVRHGPMKQQVKDMKRRVSAYSKEVIRLEKEAAKPARRNLVGG